MPWQIRWLFAQHCFAWISWEWIHKAQCVKVFNNEGEFLYDIATEGPGEQGGPAGLAVDKFDNLLVCDVRNVKVFTLEGIFVNSIKGQPAQLQEPRAVAVSNAGQVFITDIKKHCVHIFEWTTDLAASIYYKEPRDSFVLVIWV